jgi:hypothetical protein
MIASAISPEIPSSAPDRGCPIPEWLLARLRATLGVDFSGVSIHLGPAANAACTALGAAAFALDERVFFAQGSPEPFSPEGLGLLAHELAHIAQQRLGAERRRASAPVIHLEAEANAAAEAVLHDSPFRVALSDARGEPACWDLAGHYFIPYLMFLNAGVDRNLAQRIALWCWLPDQVKEFDAYTLGVNLWNPFNSDWEKARDNMAKYEGKTWLDEKQYVMAVHAGLHALNGEDGELEAAKRAKDFRDNNPLIMYRALALHPFGDCYAHRKFRGVFNADPNVTWGTTTFGLSVGHGVDGEASDHLWDENRWAVVCAYIRCLGRLANEYQGTEGIASLDDIVAALSPILRCSDRVQVRAAQQLATASAALGVVAPETWPRVVPDWSKISATARHLATANVRPDEDGCAEHILNVAQQLVHVDDIGYMHPKFEPVEWSEYFKRYRSMIIMDAGTSDPDEVFHKILQCVARWSGSALYRRVHVRRAS